MFAYSKMLVGKREYGTWKDGSSIYKDKKGYYIVAVNNKAENPMYKKYLNKWRPTPKTKQLCFTKKRWAPCKTETRKIKRSK